MSDKNLPPQHYVGEVIEKCTFIEPVGFGGHAEVWKVRDAMMDDFFAFKSLSWQVKHRDLQERFLREAKAMGRLTHPNILRVYRTVEATVPLQNGTGSFDVRGIVMQLVENGHTLAHMLERARPSAHEALRILRDICLAIIEAHAHGIVHRDLKPDNVLLQQKNGQLHVLVSDFGIALISTQGERFTKVFGSMGTPRYMAPEQYKEKTNSTPNDIDVRCDVYALAMMLYELFSGATPPESFAASIKETREEHLEKLPADIADIVRCGGSYLISERYTTVAELLVDVEKALARTDALEKPWQPRDIEQPAEHAPSVAIGLVDVSSEALLTSEALAKEVAKDVKTPRIPVHPTIVSAPEPKLEEPKVVPSILKPRHLLLFGLFIGAIAAISCGIHFWPSSQNVTPPVEMPVNVPVEIPQEAPVETRTEPVPVPPSEPPPKLIAVPVPVVEVKPRVEEVKPKVEAKPKAEPKPPVVTVASVSILHPPSAVHAKDVVNIEAKLVIPAGKSVASVTLFSKGQNGGAWQKSPAPMTVNGTTAKGSFTAASSLGPSVTVKAHLYFTDDLGTPVKSDTVTVAILSN